MLFIIVILFFNLFNDFQSLMGLDQVQSNPFLISKNNKFITSILAFTDPNKASTLAYSGLSLRHIGTDRAHTHTHMQGAMLA